MNPFEIEHGASLLYHEAVRLLREHGAGEKEVDRLRDAVMSGGRRVRIRWFDNMTFLAGTAGVEVLDAAGKRIFYAMVLIS